MFEGLIYVNEHYRSQFAGQIFLFDFNSKKAKELKLEGESFPKNKFWAHGMSSHVDVSNG